MKRYVLFLLLLSLPLSYSARAEPVTAADLWPPCYMTVVLPNTQLLNVRTQPKKDASTWGTFRGGDDVYVTALDGAWATVDYENETGYVQLRYLEITANVACTVVSNGRVRIREQPGGKASSYYQNGELVMVLAWRFDSDGKLWARTSLGFVMSDFLELVENDEDQEDDSYGE